MGRVELLQDLIHDGVGQIGDHRQLHLPAERERHRRQCFPCQYLETAASCVLLQHSVDVLRRSLHQRVANGGAWDGDLLGDGGEGRAEPLGCRAGHGAQLAAQRHHGVHHHLSGKTTT